MSTSINIHKPGRLFAFSGEYQHYEGGFTIIDFSSGGNITIHDLDQVTAARLAQAINEVFAHDEAERHADSQDAA